VSFDDCPDVVVYPRRANPVNETDRQDYFDSLTHCAAVVGVNTTAMIEAAIVRRPVFSVRDPAFAHSQQQTLHFEYLSADAGGFTTVADGLAEHVRQVEALFAEAEPDLRRSDNFVARFVRPLGMTTGATEHLCDAIERVAATRRPIRAAADTMAVDTPDAISPGR
jgi:hypothetical protein